MKEQYQNCVITLDDGSIHVFTGKAVFKKGEKRMIADVSFTEPKELPGDMTFERLEKLV